VSAKPNEGKNENVKRRRQKNQSCNSLKYSIGKITVEDDCPRILNRREQGTGYSNQIFWHGRMISACSTMQRNCSQNARRLRSRNLEYAFCSGVSPKVRFSTNVQSKMIFQSGYCKRIFANPLTVHDPSAIDPIVPYLIFLLENRINFGSLLFWAFAHVDRTRIDSRIQSVVVFDSWELPGMPTFQTKNSRRKMHLEIGDALES